MASIAGSLPSCDSMVLYVNIFAFWKRERISFQNRGCLCLPMTERTIPIYLSLWSNFLFVCLSLLKFCFILFLVMRCQLQFSCKISIFIEIWINFLRIVNIDQINISIVVEAFTFIQYDLKKKEVKHIRKTKRNKFHQQTSLQLLQR